ncbi:MAG: FxDxF family PEP-CTERM protein [Rubrivivax sp.]|nr:FxDxF family PEP-CTERM protein [Rubrivivax sp.]
MKLKSLLCAGLLAAGATASFAEDITRTIALVPSVGQPGSFSAGWGLTHLMAGAFNDTFTFTGATGAFVDAALVSIGFFQSDNINFTSATLNGQAFSLSSVGPTEVARFNLTAFSGPLTIRVAGIAGPGLANGTPIAASYAGTLNVSPVPEVHTLAMMLAGLGVVAGLARKRSQA